MSDASVLKSLRPLDQIVEVMQRLRAPVGGCPWDLEQTFETIAPYTIEEAYEVLDAIERKNLLDLKEELGDLLLQVVFHSQMAKEQGAFDINDVAQAIVDKMVRRHPHVFENDYKRSSEGQQSAWEEMKADERASKSSNQSSSALDGVARTLPALLRAEKLQKRAARVGFDWPEPMQIFSKMDEEIDEVKDALEDGNQDDIENEIGDLLFVCANLARKLNVDPEAALRKANAKFSRRFRAMEGLSAERGETFSDLPLESQEALWQDVKVRER